MSDDGGMNALDIDDAPTPVADSCDEDGVRSVQKTIHINPLIKTPPIEAINTLKSRNFVDNYQYASK